MPPVRLSVWVRSCPILAEDGPPPPPAPIIPSSTIDDVADEGRPEVGRQQTVKKYVLW